MTQSLFWLRRLRLLPGLAGCTLIALVAPWWADVTVTNPLGRQSLPLWLVMPVLTSLCAVSGATCVMSVFERSSPRWTPVLRGCLAGAVAAPPLVASLVFVGDVVLLPVVVWTLLLTALGLVSATQLGGFAWAPQVIVSAVLLHVVTSGGGRLYDWDHARALLLGAAMVLLVACSTFAIRGPASIGFGAPD